MSDSQVRDIERAIASDKVKAEAGKALERLRRNPDFKSLIVQGYLKDEAVRLVHAKADPQFDSPTRQAAIDRDINAIGAFAVFLRTTEQLGGSAMASLETNERELELIHREELSNV